MLNEPLELSTVLIHSQDQCIPSHISHSLVEIHEFENSQKIEKSQKRALCSRNSTSQMLLAFAKVATSGIIVVFFILSSLAIYVLSNLRH